MAEFSYECSICREPVAPEDCSRHANQHRDEEDWPGYMTYRRVDRPAPERGETGGPRR